MFSSEPVLFRIEGALLSAVLPNAFDVEARKTAVARAAESRGGNSPFGVAPPDGPRLNRTVDDGYGLLAGATLHIRCRRLRSIRN